MHFSLKRVKRARLLVGLSAAVIPLLAPVAANAAMGGAIPLTSTNKPDLVSVALVDANKARYCFDKQLSAASPLTAASFRLGGYRANSETPTATGVVRNLSNLNCADATFPNAVAPAASNPDLPTYSYGRVAAGAVQAQATNQPNFGDSTALTGSTTNNGTTGHTTAPDLVGVQIDATNSAINYVFDQRVGTANGAFFGYYTNTGTPTAGGATTIAENVVKVQYASVANVSRTYAFTNAVTARTVDATPNPIESAIPPGIGTGATSRPDLVSATLSADGNTIAFTYDEPLAAGNAAAFTMDLSNGGTLPGSGPVAISGNTATVTFPGGSSVNEYAVEASAADSAVSALNGGQTSTLAGVPVGDNAGAFASGFTTAADARAIAFNNTTGVVLVALDQRIAASTPASIRLLDANGDDTGAVPTSATFPAGGTNGKAGPAFLTVQFTPQQLSIAKGLYLAQGATSTSLANPSDAQNVPQVLGTTATAAVLRPGAHVRWRKGSTHRRVSRSALRRPATARSIARGRAMVKKHR